MRALNLVEDPLISTFKLATVLIFNEMHGNVCVNTYSKSHKRCLLLMCVGLAIQYV